MSRTFAVLDSPMKPSWDTLKCPDLTPYFFCVRFPVTDGYGCGRFILSAAADHNSGLIT